MLIHKRQYIGGFENQFHIYEADKEASAVSTRVRQNVEHEANGEARRSYLRIRTLQNGR